MFKSLTRESEQLNDDYQNFFDEQQYLKDSVFKNDIVRESVIRREYSNTQFKPEDIKNLRKCIQQLNAAAFSQNHQARQNIKINKELFHAKVGQFSPKILGDGNNTLDEILDTNLYLFLKIDGINLEEQDEIKLCLMIESDFKYSNQASFIKDQVNYIPYKKSGDKWVFIELQMKHLMGHNIAIVMKVIRNTKVQQDVELNKFFITQKTYGVYKQQEAFHILPLSKIFWDTKLKDGEFYSVQGKFYREKQKIFDKNDIEENYTKYTNMTQSQLDKFLSKSTTSRIQFKYQYALSQECHVKNQNLDNSIVIRRNQFSNQSFASKDKYLQYLKLKYLRMRLNDIRIDLKALTLSKQALKDSNGIRIEVLLRDERGKCIELLYETFMEHNSPSLKTYNSQIYLADPKLTLRDSFYLRIPTTKLRNLSKLYLVFVVQLSQKQKIRANFPQAIQNLKSSFSNNSSNFKSSALRNQSEVSSSNMSVTQSEIENQIVPEFSMNNHSAFNFKSTFVGVQKLMNEQTDTLICQQSSPYPVKLFKFEDIKMMKCNSYADFSKYLTLTDYRLEMNNVVFSEVFTHKKELNEMLKINPSKIDMESAKQNERIQKILIEIKKINHDYIINFHKVILDKLFELMQHSKSNQTLDVVFSLLAYIIETFQLDKYKEYFVLLQEYIQNDFNEAQIFKPMINQIFSDSEVISQGYNEDQANSQQLEKDDIVLANLNHLHIFLKFINKSYSDCKKVQDKQKRFRSDLTTRQSNRISKNLGSLKVPMVSEEIETEMNNSDEIDNQISQMENNSKKQTEMLQAANQMYDALNQTAPLVYASNKYGNDQRYSENSKNYEEFLRSSIYNNDQLISSQIIDNQNTSMKIKQDQSLDTSQGAVGNKNVNRSMTMNSNQSNQNVNKTFDYINTKTNMLIQSNVPSNINTVDLTNEVQQVTSQKQFANLKNQYVMSVINEVDEEDKNIDMSRTLGQSNAHIDRSEQKFSDEKNKSSFGQMHMSSRNFNKQKIQSEKIKNSLVIRKDSSTDEQAMELFDSKINQKFQQMEMEDEQNKMIFRSFNKLEESLPQVEELKQSVDQMQQQDSSQSVQQMSQSLDQNELRMSTYNQSKVITNEERNNSEQFDLVNVNHQTKEGNTQDNYLNDLKLREEINYTQEQVSRLVQLSLLQIFRKCHHDRTRWQMSIRSTMYEQLIKVISEIELFINEDFIMNFFQLMLSKGKNEIGNNQGMMVPRHAQNSLGDSDSIQNQSMSLINATEINQSRNFDQSISKIAAEENQLHITTELGKTIVYEDFHDIKKKRVDNQFFRINDIQLAKTKIKTMGQIMSSNILIRYNRDAITIIQNFCEDIKVNYLKYKEFKYYIYYFLHELFVFLQAYEQSINKTIDDIYIDETQRMIQMKKTNKYLSMIVNIQKFLTSIACEAVKIMITFMEDPVTSLKRDDYQIYKVLKPLEDKIPLICFSVLGHIEKEDFQKMIKENPKKICAFIDNLSIILKKLAFKKPLDQYFENKKIALIFSLNQRVIEYIIDRKNQNLFDTPSVSSNINQAKLNQKSPIQKNLILSKSGGIYSNFSKDQKKLKEENINLVNKSFQLQVYLYVLLTQRKYENDSQKSLNFNYKDPFGISKRKVRETLIEFWNATKSLIKPHQTDIPYFKDLISLLQFCQNYDSRKDQFKILDILFLLISNIGEYEFQDNKNLKITQNLFFLIYKFLDLHEPEQQPLYDYIFTDLYESVGKKLETYHSKAPKLKLPYDNSEETFKWNYDQIFVNVKKFHKAMLEVCDALNNQVLNKSQFYISYLWSQVFQIIIDLNLYELFSKHEKKFNKAQTAIQNYEGKVFMKIKFIDIIQNFDNYTLSKIGNKVVIDRLIIDNIDIVLEDLHNVCLYDEIMTLYEKKKNLYLDVLYDLVEVSKVQQEVSTVYQAMSEQTKWEYANYFKLSFWGSEWPDTLKGKHFIYRGPRLSKKEDIQQFFNAQFDNVKYHLLNKFPEKDIIESQQKYIQIIKVEPLSWQKIKEYGLTEVQQTKFEKELERKANNVPNRRKQYYIDNYVDKFIIEKPFKPPHETDELDDLENDIRLEIYYVKCKFPNIFIMQEITKSQKDTRINCCQKQVGYLSYLTTNLQQATQQVIENKTDNNLETMTSQLTGLVDAPINGGIMKIIKVFLRDKYFIGDTKKDGEQLQQALDFCLATLEDALGVYDQYNEKEKQAQKFYSNFKIIKRTYEEALNALNRDQMVIAKSVFFQDFE